MKRRKPCDRWREHVTALSALMEDMMLFPDRAPIASVKAVLSWTQRQLGQCETLYAKFEREVLAPTEGVSRGK